MSDREDDDLAARSVLGGRAHSTADRHDKDRHCPWRKSDFPSDNDAFERCRVKSHEDFPRHIYSLFLVLGIQFRWVLTQGTLACALVSQADLVINDAKENAWMALYEHDSDTLEDILYRSLQDLWAPLTDTMKVLLEMRLFHAYFFSSGCPLTASLIRCERPLEIPAST